MARRFKEILAKNELCRLFALGRLINPVLIDLFGLAGGFDGIWLDQEHVGLTYQEIQLATLAARGQRVRYVRANAADQLRPGHSKP